MAVSATRVAVAATAVALNTAAPAGQSLIVKNGTGILDLGASDVTSGGGLSVVASAVVQVELDSGDVLFAISDVTGTNVEVLRT